MSRRESKHEQDEHEEFIPIRRKRMTEELNDFYKDFFQTCGPAFGRHLLRPASPPSKRQPRKSILKEPPKDHDLQLSRSALHFDHGYEQLQSRRRSSFHPHQVKFEKNVEVMSTIKKVTGLDEALENQTKKLKPQRQITITSGPSGHVPIFPPAHISNEEVFPLHIRDPAKTKLPKVTPPNLTMEEEEGLESKRARQELARMYFTHEATKIVACSMQGTFEKNRTDVVLKKKNSLPRFFMDKLQADKEKELSQKKRDNIKAIQSEMDAFDEDVFQKKEYPPSFGICSTFNPKDIQPSEKSLINLKLKVEVSKRQKDRDVEAAAERNLCRRVYFQQKIASLGFPDIIEKDLIEFAKDREPLTVSLEELEMRRELEEVVMKCVELEENRKNYEKDKSKISPAEEVMNVLVSTAVDSAEYRSIMKRKPRKCLVAEWRRNLFAYMDDPNCETAEAVSTCLDVAWDVLDVLMEVAMNKSDYTNLHGHEPSQGTIYRWTDNLFASWIRYPECNNDIDTREAQRPSRQTINGIIETLLEMTVRISEYKEHHDGEEPPLSLVKEWRDKYFEELHEGHHDEEDEDGSEDIVKNILGVVLDCVDRISYYRLRTGMQPPDSLCQEWREKLFECLYESQKVCTGVKEETNEEMVRDILGVLIDTAIKASDFRYHTRQHAPACLLEEWRDEMFSDLFMEENPDEYTTDEMIQDVLEVVEEIKISDYYHRNNGTKPEEVQVQEWREYYFELIQFVPCDSSPKAEESRLAQVLVRDILDEMVDNVIKISECREKGDDLSEDSSCLLWKGRGYFGHEEEEEEEEDTNYDYCVRIMRETDNMVREIIDEMVEKAMNISDCNANLDHKLPQCPEAKACLKMREGILNVSSPVDDEEEEEEDDDICIDTPRVSVTVMDDDMTHTE